MDFVIIKTSHINSLILKLKLHIASTTRTKTVIYLLLYTNHTKKLYMIQEHVVV